jgi:hypothetical protein
MTKSKYIRNEADVQKLLKNGRGSGSGGQFIPYFFVRDVPSIGRSHRILSRHSSRVHHLLSDLEYAHYLAFDADDTVIDIREQVALDRIVTTRIASTLGIRHPKAPGSDTTFVMTTDLLITYQVSSEPTYLAVSVKPSTEINKPRTRDKLRLEEAYWHEKGILFKILTELDVSLHTKRSLQWLRQYRDLTNFAEPSSGYFDNLMQRVLICISDTRRFHITLAECCTLLDAKYLDEPGTHLMIARHMLASRKLLTNLNREKIWNTPVSEIKISPRH